ncbi:hypothetical protein [Granulicella sp. S190]|uniref:hypothetical protein n=1 Tax=Granulicella sp. S190 TaxID=1747226 RepID=UPI00131D52BE|nr:hypothetical protein [Granulicella sp. S190]
MKFGRSGSISSLLLVDKQVSEQAKKQLLGQPDLQSGIFDSSRLRETQRGAVDSSFEATTLARLLASLTLSSTLEEALARFYSFLPEPELHLRISVVLARMYEILPEDIASKLRRIGSLSVNLLTRTGAAKRSQSESLGLLSLLLVSGLILVLAVVGAFTTYGYVAAHFHPLTAGTTSNRILKNLFFMVCTCSEHSK